MLSIGVVFCLLGIVLVALNIGENSDDRSYFGGWISIAAGAVALFRWFLDLIGG